MRLRYAMKGIKLNSIFTILLLIQLILSFNAIYNTMDIKKKVSNEVTKITGYFEGKDIYNLRQADMLDLFNKDLYPKVNESSLENTFEYLNNHEEFIFTHHVILPMIIETFEGNEQFHEYPMEENIDGKRFSHIKSITLNERTLNKFNIKLESGRFFNDDEMKLEYGIDNSIPIIVGSNYGEFFKVGEEINTIKNGEIVKANIIGILEENQYMPIDMNSHDNRRYVDLNNYILNTYSSLESYKTMYDTMFYYNFMFFNKDLSNERIQEINKEIKTIFYKNLGLTIDIKDIKKSIEAELNIFKKQEKIVSITSICITIFVSLTLIISTLNSILKRKKEFGVHIFSGGTLFDIAITIYMETLIVLLVSFIIAMGIVFRQNKEIDLTSLLGVFIVLIIISIVTTVLPIVKISSIKINDIIKGVE